MKRLYDILIDHEERTSRSFSVVAESIADAERIALTHVRSEYAGIDGYYVAEIRANPRQVILECNNG